MYELLRASTGAGFGRSLLERLVAAQGGDDLVNRLTAGLGTIESAEPAGRPLATRALGGGVAGAGRAVRRRAEPMSSIGSGSRPTPTYDGSSSTSTCSSLATVPAARRSGSSPSRRGGPSRRSPWRRSTGCAARRPSVIPRRSGAGSPPSERLSPSGRGRRCRAASAGRSTWRCASTTLYSAQREGVKAAFVRLLDLPRHVLIELARRAGLPHDDLCLLTIDELPAALADHAALAATIAERRSRRRYLQARIPPFWFEGAIPPPPTWELRGDRLRPDRQGRVLTGLGVCAGTATGPARVVTDPADPRELGPLRHPRRPDHRPVVDAAVPRRGRGRGRRRRPAEPRRDRRPRTGNPRGGERRARLDHDPRRHDDHRRRIERAGHRPRHGLTSRITRRGALTRCGGGPTARAAPRAARTRRCGSCPCSARRPWSRPRS